MSGIAGYVNLDGAPIDAGILARMMEAIAFRGPDAGETWAGEAACLAHTLLRTTDESAGEHQPLSFDGKVWMVADARIDARQELVTELRGRGHEARMDVPDAELLLRAWCVWGEECVDHLLGDFAFAVWDAGRKRLFCARDQMGIKPFYYAQIGSCVIFSNTLDCVRRHPRVSTRLNELAIADFLLFHSNQDAGTTMFADIQRLPGGHTAVWDGGGRRLRRYWTLPIEEPVFYRRQRDYVVHFQELLKTAVGDRLRSGRVGVFMSGGQDSTSLAATARNLLQERSGNGAVRAFTGLQGGEDVEGRYAGLAAKSLGIPIEYEDTLAGIDAEWYRKPLHTPEPIPWPTNLARERDHFQHMAEHSRIAFYGEGPDNALSYEWRPYLAYLLRQRRFGRVLYDVAGHVLAHRKIPVGALLRRREPVRPGNEDTKPPYPEWLHPDFEKRWRLRERAEAVRAAGVPRHPVHPDAYESFALSLWRDIFTMFDAEYTKAPLEVRHPYLDLRLLRYMLRVPAVPWCRSKYILRKSMEGLLPRALLERPKTGISRNLWDERVLANGMPPVSPVRQLDTYVDFGRVGERPAGGPASFWVDFGIRSLVFWWQNLDL